MSNAVLSNGLFGGDGLVAALALHHTVALGFNVIVTERIKSSYARIVNSSAGALVIGVAGGLTGCRNRFGNIVGVAACCRYLVIITVNAANAAFEVLMTDSCAARSHIAICILGELMTACRCCYNIIACRATGGGAGINIVAAVGAGGLNRFSKSIVVRNLIKRCNKLCGAAGGGAGVGYASGRLTGRVNNYAIRIIKGMRKLCNFLAVKNCRAAFSCAFNGCRAFAQAGCRSKLNIAGKVTECRNFFGVIAFAIGMNRAGEGPYSLFGAGRFLGNRRREAVTRSGNYGFELFCAAVVRAFVNYIAVFGGRCVLLAHEHAEIMTGCIFYGKAAFIKLSAGGALFIAVAAFGAGRIFVCRLDGFPGVASGCRNGFGFEDCIAVLAFKHLIAVAVAVCSPDNRPVVLCSVRGRIFNLHHVHMIAAGVCAFICLVAGGGAGCGL